MSIWILAIIVVGLTVLAGWRQGGIRAAIGFVGIPVAVLFSGLVGKLFHLLLPVFGVRTSAATLLRLVQRAPAPTFPTLRVRGGSTTGRADADTPTAPCSSTRSYARP